MHGKTLTIKYLILLLNTSHTTLSSDEWAEEEPWLWLMKLGITESQVYVDGCVLFLDTRYGKTCEKKKMM